jgi:MFS family permease
MAALTARLSRPFSALGLTGFSPGVRRAVRVDMSAAVLTAIFTGLTLPFVGIILRRELGATPLQLSILASANAACLLLSLLLVRVVDTRRPLPYVVWPLFLARGLLLLAPLVHSPWPFVGLLVAGTLLGTVQGPAQTALVEQLYPKPERGRALGTVRTVGAVLAIGLGAITGHLLGWFSWRWVFAGAALVGMAASLRLRSLPVPETPVAATSAPAPRASLSDAWHTLREDHRYRRLLLGSSVFGAGIWIQMPATPLLLADVLHATTAQIGVFAAAAAVAALGGNLVWGRLADGRSSLRALQAVYVVGMLTPLIYFFSRTPWMLLGAAVTESLMATGLDLVWMLVVIDFAGRRSTAQYAAIGATLAGVRGVIGPFLGAAVIHAFGVHAVFLVAAAFMAAGAWLVSRHAGAAETEAAAPRSRRGAARLIAATTR